MFRRRRVVFGLTMLAVVLAAGVVAWRRLHRPPLPPFEVSLWYWHQPFRMSTAEIAQLRALGVRQLFVRAATFKRNGNSVRLVLPEAWSSRADGLDIHLVFNFDYDIVRHYAETPNESLAAGIGQVIRQEKTRAERAGMHVAGVQLDFDCPTSRLTRYADLLHRLRPMLGAPGMAFSITALPTWFGSGDVRQVMEAVDFTVPQYYEAQTPKMLDQFAPISRLSMVERGMKAAGGTGQPFYVGIPAYGHALVYNTHGRLLGMYRDMGVSETARRPEFRLVRAFPADSGGQRATPATYIGENIYDFIANVPAGDGQGPGYHLVYDLPTPTLVAQHLALVRAQRPPNCRGAILFRYPEPDETETLPLPALAAAIRGDPIKPDLRVRMSVASAPWELIETGRRAARAPLDLVIRVTNDGTSGTIVAPDALTMTLRFDRPGLDDVTARRFDSVETIFDSTQGGHGGAPLRASIPRANTIELRRFYLAAGETATIGPIRVRTDGPTKVWGEWTMRDAGGFDVIRGQIAPMNLVPGEKR